MAQILNVDHMNDCEELSTLDGLENLAWRRHRGSEPVHTGEGIKIPKLLKNRGHYID